jgi:hypothetical protein
MKGRNHLTKKRLDKRIQEKWALKKYRRGCTLDLYRSGNGSTRSREVRDLMKEKYCSSANPVASKGLSSKSLCIGWCSEFLFKVPKFRNVRWNTVRSSVFHSQPTRNLTGCGLNSDTATLFEILFHSLVLSYPSTRYGSDMMRSNWTGP